MPPDSGQKEEFRFYSWEFKFPMYVFAVGFGSCMTSKRHDPNPILSLRPRPLGVRAGSSRSGPFTTHKLLAENLTKAHAVSTENGPA